MDEYDRRAVRGSFYLRRRADGRRTRLYTTLEACRRAANRGELYTDEEYAALTAIGGRRRKDAA